MIDPDLLRRIRNDLPMAVLIAALGRDGPPSKVRDGRFVFLCPHCGEMETVGNPRNNLAHCFSCTKNLNTIDLLRLRENEIASIGVGRKFQKPTVFEHLSVFENLELALKADRGVRASMFFRLNGEQLDRIGAMLTLIHLKDSAQRIAGLLSHGQKQWLEIGMLLMQDPKLLLLDEPVAGMTDEETERTAELFLSLEGNHSLVVVEHDMKFIGELTQGKASKKVTVLHEGSVLAEGSLADVQGNDKVVEVYLGR